MSKLILLIAAIVVTNNQISIIKAVTVSSSMAFNGNGASSVTDIKLLCVGGYKFVFTGGYTDSPTTIVQIFDAQGKGVPCN